MAQTFEVWDPTGFGMWPNLLESVRLDEEIEDRFMDELNLAVSVPLLARLDGFHQALGTIQYESVVPLEVKTTLGRINRKGVGASPNVYCME